jgi:hypothetical protein
MQIQIHSTDFKESKVPAKSFSAYQVMLKYSCMKYVHIVMYSNNPIIWSVSLFRQDLLWN